MFGLFWKQFKYKQIFLGGQEALCSVRKQVLQEYLQADGD